MLESKDTLGAVADTLLARVEARDVDEAKTNYANGLASGEAPEKASERLLRAQNLGIFPEDLDAADPVQKFKTETDAIDWHRMQNEAPKTLSLLRNQSTVNVVKGDVNAWWQMEGLKQRLTWKIGGWAERTPDRAGVGNAAARGATSAGATFPMLSLQATVDSLHKMQDLKEKLARAKTPEERLAYFKGAENPELALKVFEASVDSRIASAQRVINANAELVSNYQYRLSQLAQTESAKKLSETEGLLDSLKMIFSDPQLLLHQGVESMVGNAPALAAMSFMGPQAGALVMGAASMARETSGEYLEGLSQRTDLANPALTARFLSDPNNADFLAKLSEQAKRKGLVVGTFDALSVGMVKPFEGLLAKVFQGSGKGSAVMRAFTQLEAQGLMGGGGEALGQIAAQGKVTSWSEVAAEFAGEHFTGPIEIFSALRGEKAKNDNLKAQAGANEEALRKLAAQWNALQNKDPIVAKEVLDGIAPGLVAGDAENSQILQVNVGALLQENPQLEGEITATLENNKDLLERVMAAKAEGKPVAMSLSEYAQTFAPLDQGEGVVAQHVGVGDVPSLAEVNAQEADLREAGEAAVKKLTEEAMSQRREEIAQVQQEVRNAMGTLKGVSDEEVNGISLLWAHMLTSFASDLSEGGEKVSPVDLWRQQSVDFMNGAKKGARGFWSTGPKFWTQGKLGRITLTRTVDRSTLLHESGHAFLDFRWQLLKSIYKKRAEGVTLTPGEARQLELNDQILKWLGTNWEEWQTLRYQKRGGNLHEKFAESFEEYLRTGQAPTKGLREVFDRFKEWLKQIYKTALAGRRADLTPESKQLFDQLFLSRELSQGFMMKNSMLYDMSFIKSSTANVDVEDKVDAIDDTKTILGAVEAHIQKSYEALARRIKNKRKSSKKTARQRAEKIYADSKAAKAIKALKGETGAQPVVIHGALLEELGFGQWQIDKLYKAGLVRKKKGVTVSDRAMLEQYAQALGYDNATAMLTDVLPNINEKEAIERIADNLYAANNIEEDVAEILRNAPMEEAVFNSEMMRAVNGVLKTMQKLAKSVEETSGEAIRLAAKSYVDVTDRKKHSLKAYAGNARTNARLARKAFLAGDVQTAIKYQKKALYFMELGNAVIESRKEYKRGLKVIRRARKQDNPKVSGRYLDLIHRTLVALGIKSRKYFHLNETDMSLSEQFAKLGLDQYFSPEFLEKLDTEERLNERGEHVVMRPVLSKEGEAYLKANLVRTEADAKRNKLKTQEEIDAWNEKVREEALGENPDYEYDGMNMNTPAGFRTVIDLLRTLEDAGERAKQIRKEEETVTIEESIALMVNEIEERAKANKQKKRVEFEDMTLKSRIKNFVKNGWTSHLRIHTLLKRMAREGSKVFDQLVLHKVDAADSRKEALTAQITEQLHKAMEPLSKILSDTSKVDTSELDKAFRSFAESLSIVKYGKGVAKGFTKQELVFLALNMGNEGNAQRALATVAARLGLYNPGQYVNSALQSAVWAFINQNMTTEELKAIQQVWNVFDVVQKETAATVERMDGKEPEWVDKEGVTLIRPDGTKVELKGGYYPIRYDRRASHAPAINDISDAMEGISVFANGGPNDGHIKARVRDVPTDMYLTLTDRALYEGLGAQIHYVAWAETMHEFVRLFDPQSQLTKTIRDYWGKESVDYIHQWMKQIALDGRSQGDSGGWNESASWLRQGVSIAGVGGNLVTAAVQIVGFTQTIAHVGPGYALKALCKYLFSGGPLGLGSENTFVHANSVMMQNRARTRFRELRELHAKVGGRYTNWHKKTMQVAYWPIGYMQSVVDDATWLAAYDKAIDQGVEHDMAIKEADRAVLETQGSGRLSNLAKVERGDEWLKLFTVFYTFFNSTLNLLALSGYQKDKVAFARDIFVIALLQPIIEGFMREAIKDAGGTDDDTPWWQRASDPAYMASKVINFNMNYFVFMRDMSGVSDLLTGKRVQASYPGGLRKLTDVMNLANELPKIAEGDWDINTTRKMVRALGPILQMPVVPIDRILSGFEANDKGEANAGILSYVFGYSH